MIRTTLFIVMLMVGGTSASAETCFSKAEWWTSETRHEALELEPLSREEFRALEATFRKLRKLQGKVSGTENGFICKGTEKASRRETSQSTIEGTVRAGHGSFTLSAELDTKRKSRTEKFSLDLDRDYLVTPIRSKVEVLSASSGEIEFRERAGGKNSLGGRVIMDRLISLKVRDNTLTISYKVYAQGQLTSQSTWKVRRRH